MNHLKKTHTMKFLLFDDLKIFSKSFKLLLRENGYTDVFICNTSTEVDERLSAGEEVVIFTDFMIPETDVSMLIKKWKSHINVRLVVMSGITSPHQIAGIMRNRADGFLSKSAETEEIFFCIKEILQKRTYISKEFQSEVMKILINGNENLFTPRELEVIQLIKEGKSIKEKAKILFLSENTIIVHRRNIMQKAGVNSITELVLKMAEHNF